MNSIIISPLLVLCLILITVSNTKGDASYCIESSGNFTTNSSYARNLNLILTSLPSNTTSADRLYYTATVGRGPDQVYALSLCRADSSPADCTDCVGNTVRAMREHCPNRREAYSWRSHICKVRYSNRPDMIGKLSLDPTSNGYNTGAITTNMTEFDQKWEGLMIKVLTRASMGSNKLKFATGNVDLTLFEKIYTMMQCMPDLTESDCNECLRGVVSSYQGCCHGQQGGFIHKPSCFFRWDLYPFYSSSLDAPSPSTPPLPPPLPLVPPNPKASVLKSSSSSTLVIAVITSITLTSFVVVLLYILLRRRTWKRVVQGDGDDISAVESLQVDFRTIRAATNDFSDDNKLGQGGFGAVYKGRLPNGEDIAVKRLSKGSGQGQVEFKNEVMVVARLEHRNLVRLLGFCLEREERLLIYELVENSSLDNYLFDPTKRRILDWKKRYKILEGIARGLLYLHQDSRLRIIHRDLKASNILLDEDMNPKISDFGMARMFAVDQTQDDTSRIVGTFGYMSPEYVRNGHFSVKSDVFSFGVLVLEIISGQKNSAFRNGEEGESLLTYAWKKWKEGMAMNIVDTSLRGGSRSEMLRCINIGLLCVQENEADRPTMASVAVMLSSHSMTLNVPSKPAFFIYSSTMVQPKPSTRLSRFSSSLTDKTRTDTGAFSVNEVSITELYPR